MKPGQPKLRTRPPAKSASESEHALERLDALGEWTEQPSREIATAIRSDESKDAPAEPPKAPKAASKQKREVYPWEEIEYSTSTNLKPMNMRVPDVMYRKLKWLSDNRINGMNQTQIIILAIETQIEKMLKERGLT